MKECARNACSCFEKHAHHRLCTIYQHAHVRGYDEADCSILLVVTALQDHHSEVEQEMSAST
jgi:hypothetical protein